jgi:hypothetical protein
MRRVELAPERPGRQQRVTGERSIEPPYGDGRRLQLDDHIIVGEPIPDARPLWLFLNFCTVASVNLRGTATVIGSALFLYVFITAA